MVFEPLHIFFAAFHEALDIRSWLAKAIAGLCHKPPELEDGTALWAMILGIMSFI